MSNIRKGLRGLYAITPDEGDDARLESLVSQILHARPALLQYRNKPAGVAQKRRQADRLAALCRAADVPLIINDDPRLARDCGAQGVHLGGDDGSVTAARALLGDSAIIGVSCYASLALAEQAQRDGASYVAFGSVFGSLTKPDAPRAGFDVLMQACRSLSLPVCAIGGIDRGNAPPLIDAGVDLLAVISDVFGSDDPAAAARELQQLFNNRTSR